MTDDSPVILFCCNRLAPTLEMAHVIRGALRCGRYRVLVLLGSQSLQTQIAADLFGGAETLIFTKLLRSHQSIDLPRIVGLLARIFRLLKIDFLADALLVRRNAIQGQRVFNRLNKTYPLHLVAISDDRTLGWDFGVAHAANVAGCKTVAIPFALSDPDADWISRENRETFDVSRGGFISRAIKKKMATDFPENLRIKSGRGRMFLTSGQAWIVKRIGAGFRQPWAYGGGITSKVAVYGEADRAKQIKLHVPEDKIAITGQPAMDVLYKARQSEREVRMDLHNQLSLLPDSPVVICAVPQYLEHGMLGARDHWRLTEQMISSLSATGANVVLSLHPRSRSADYHQVARKHGAVISQRPLIEILSAGDLFVATHSSTVRWAILMRIPVIVLDDFSVGESALYADGGVHFVRERQELSALAASLLQDTSRRAEIIRRMDELAIKLDPFDGENVGRTLALFDEMISKRPSP